jgi:hypothetical protein
MVNFLFFEGPFIPAPPVAGIEDDWDAEEEEIPKPTKPLPTPKIPDKKLPTPVAMPVAKPTTTPKKVDADDWDDDDDNVNLEDPDEDEFYKYEVHSHTILIGKETTRTRRKTQT